MKRVWISSALALCAASPSMAQDNCAQAALAYYCTAVTTALGQTAGGDLGTALLTQSGEYGTLSKSLGYSSLKQKYFEIGVNDVAKAKNKGVVERLIKICVSKDADAISTFKELTGTACSNASESSGSDMLSTEGSDIPKESSDTEMLSTEGSDMPKERSSQ